ncbi:AlbA family DNA-binding domain-containing protein [Xylanibacter oryzae]|uniref:AlbA family DNA-binding domain-containing protein n=1 Tax=Xylanibacter oryzae TaxID=185293 RepID=UPI0004BA3B18|nr:hypothetical protein [Xylanibacter oryzae]
MKKENRNKMKEQNIQELLANGEHVTLECKKAQTCVLNSLWETCSAFANTYDGNSTEHT